MQTAPVAHGAAVARPPDISELLAQAVETYRREAAGGAQAEPAATGTHTDVGVVFAQALAASRQQGVVSTPDVATVTVEGVGERVELRQPKDVDAGRTSAERSVEQMQEGAMDQGAVAPCGGRTEVEGVEEWMWEWREWLNVAPGEPCPAGVVFCMDLATGTNHARLPDSLRARLDAAEAAGGGDANKQPLAPFPPQPESPLAEAAEGEGERAHDVAVEDVEEEEEYGPGESALARMYEDAEPDVYVGMDPDPANAPLLPMPTAVPPPPLRSCEQWHCRFDAAEDVHQHHLRDEGRREATPLERYKFQPPGQVARERGLEAVRPDDGRVSCVQLGDAAVLDHHPGEVRAAEPPENLPLSVRLSVGRLIDEAGLEDARRDGLYVALWRSGAGAWRRGLGVRPLTPQAPGSHAVLVAIHPEGMEVVFGEDGTNCMALAADSAVLVPTSSSYRLVSCGGDARLLVVVGTRHEADEGHRGPEQCTVAVEEEEAAGASVGHEGETEGSHDERPTAEGRQKEQGPDPGPSKVDEKVDVKAHVEAALARIMAVAGLPPAAEAMEKDNQSRERSKVREAMEGDEGLEIVGAKGRTRWGNKGRGCRTELGPRRGTWKPAGIGPRGGACGRMHAASHTLSHRCRREYPRVC